MRVGVLGGTFDPIHLGHLKIAEEARLKLDLERVLFIPTGQPRLRTDKYLSPVADRLRMVELATSDNPYFQVCDNETRRGGPTYTVDTLIELRGSLGTDASLYFIVGVDILRRFHDWKEPERVLELCNVVVVTRPGHEDFDWPAWLVTFPQAADRLTRLDTTMVDISGTEIRRRSGQGKSVRKLVPASVAEYIQERNLYTQQ
ncbi:MAG: nicotinic acid mononucleotide adenylyltransferase [Chloroflexi bacterium]|nr:nicotinic acid mononucleotide adenylyltransferase [Chloroflexota bacterium]HIB10697.1 nicotinate-nucleotide adenylyltransferase [Dehalococcoidia bacterium]